MTDRERMLRAARGERTDRLPFAPRLDLWHNANVRRGTLPKPYGPDTPASRIADDLGVAPHRIIPEFLKKPNVLLPTIESTLVTPYSTYEVEVSSVVHSKVAVVAVTPETVGPAVITGAKVSTGRMWTWWQLSHV